MAAQVFRYGSPSPAVPAGSRLVALVSGGNSHPSWGPFTYLDEFLRVALLAHDLNLVHVPLQEAEEWSSQGWPGRVYGCLVNQAASGFLDRIAASGVPTVALNVPGRAGVPAVGFDDLGGMTAGMEYLLGLGHRHLVWVARATERHAQSYLERHAVVVRLARQAGAVVDQVTVEPHAPQQLRAYLRHPDHATALVAYSSEVWCDCLPMVRAEGIAIPDSLSVLVADDAPWLHVLTPGYTAITLPVADMAAAAVERLIKPGCDILLPEVLTVRASCAPLTRRPPRS